MNKTGNLLQVITRLLLLGALMLGVVVAFQMLRSGAPGAPAKTSPGYPPPESTLPVPGPTLPLESTLIFDISQSPTPWLTFTPLPISTPKPGPTQTVIALQPPAEDSAGEIRYVVYSSVGLYEGNRGAIHSVKTDAQGNIAESTTPTIYEIDAAWSGLQLSPDGNRVALIEGVEAGQVVNIYDLLTGRLADIFQGKGGGIGVFLGWHPDSRHVLQIVTTNFSGPSGGLWLVEVDTGEITVIANQQIGSTYEAAVSPDGQKVAYYLSGMAEEIWMINVDGTDPRIIYTRKGGYLGAITWSPDGRQIAFIGDGLMVISRDGTNLRQLIKPWTKSSSEPWPRGPAGGGCLGLTWSPDSQEIACVSYDIHNITKDKGVVVTDKDAFEGAAIYLVDVATGEARPLLADESTGHVDPTWSPGGSQIAFASMRSGAPQIWTVNVDGSNLRQVTNGGQLVRFPFWLRSQERESGVRPLITSSAHWV